MFVIIKRILVLKLLGCNIQGTFCKVLDKVQREGVLKKAIFIITLSLTHSASENDCILLAE